MVWMKLRCLLRRCSAGGWSISAVAADVRRRNRRQRAHDRAAEEGHGHGIIVGGTALVFAPPTPVSEAG